MIAPDSQTLADLYASAAGKQDWQVPLDRLCKELGVRSAVIQRFRITAGRLRTSWMARDGHSRLCAALHDPVVNDDANPRMWFSSGLGDVRQFSNNGAFLIANDDTLPLPAAQKQKFHQDLRAVGLGQFCDLAFESDGAFCSLALHAAPDAALPEWIAQSLAALAPHLQTALSIQQSLEQSAIRLRDFETTLDHLRTALVVCDAQACVVWHNRSAAAELGPGAPLRIQNKHLIARRAEHCRALHQLFQATLQIPGLLLPERCLTLHGGTSRLQIMALPLSGARAEPHLALVLGQAGGAASLPAAALTALLGLTQAETRLAHAIAQGFSVREYAVTHQFSEAATRVSLKRLLAKTGCGRQSELVRLIGNSPAGQILPH